MYQKNVYLSLDESVTALRDRITKKTNIHSMLNNHNLTACPENIKQFQSYKEELLLFKLNHKDENDQCSPISTEIKRNSHGFFKTIVQCAADSSS